MLRIRTIAVALLCVTLFASAAVTAETGRSKLRAMLLTGQMNEPHNPDLMDLAVTRYLEETGLFEVTEVRTPARGGNMSGFAPDFGAFDVVVLNYDGDDWPAETRAAFIRYVADGGGLVSVHSSDNAFPDWPAFNHMIALGGWGGRDENWGPALYWGEDGPERYYDPGKTFHPPQHDYMITTRDSVHPITAGMPEQWMHAHDELYSMLRGPAENVELLATGFADPEAGRTSGRHEPVLFTVTYGKGRVFHTPLGHIGRNETELPASVRCAGFITALQRGAEWAATGSVSQKLPEDFPAAGAVSVRP